jgi:hypothetical protein
MVAGEDNTIGTDVEVAMAKIIKPKKTVPDVRQRALTVRLSPGRAGYSARIALQLALARDPLDVPREPDRLEAADDKR